MSVRLYVGNLPRELSREELEALFNQEVGEVGTTKLITDRKTGKCRGFGFVTVESEEVADQVIEKLNGYTFKDNPLKIEKANDKPKSEAKENKEKEETVAEKPTPSNRNNRKNNKNNGRRTQANSAPAEYSSMDTEAAQPDPRWADALAQLKERLLAQSSNA
ncbi:RNA-binding protein [Thermosynechococcus sp. JY1334]|uniref:RNA recognition motif domain-containing protein n=1 Tax=unclassified Thermosynechococcus TaxID=2622553 RepID=UPI002672925C|nr:MULTISPECIES: RNA-binding protein [unclassified Thermosynechococcus]MDR7897442.1 RNA-binding protein [Thermosynechococcus sp. JY1332]MDR7904847.1 RNA-binding protein [Thermosynechococcus sp. JY1334]MDR7992672.1 RNA-binding protein [Thermosynechococcus sp. TG252]WKT87072.1 RNA-binding protein [Thermosynechococcus sp. JY1339]WNC56015.1 RNA-binding protein [Thermosynechococcus sp. JY1331]